MNFNLAVFVCLAGTSLVAAWSLTKATRMSLTELKAKQAGTFFNPVPEDDNDKGKTEDGAEESTSFDEKAAELLRQRKGPSLASQPSTINGKPTSGVGFGKKINPPGKSKPFVGIGPVLNDPTKPEYDDQGYTLFADEKTGQKSRVFEALVDYPCKFTMKIVGAKEGNFVEEMVAVVAESCEVNVDDISHSIRKQGKWVSVTVRAPVSITIDVYVWC